MPVSKMQRSICHNIPACKKWTTNRRNDTSGRESHQGLTYTYIWQQWKFDWTKYTTNNTVTINTHSATDCTIYAIANTGTPELFNSYDIHWENNLKTRLTLSMIGTVWQKQCIAYDRKPKPHKYSYWKQFASGYNSKTNSCKITLNVNIDQGYGINIDSYRIYGIPNKTYYVLHPLDTESEPTDTQTTRAKDAAIPSQPTDWTDSGSISPNSPTNINTIFYMFENRAGINTTITQQKEK